jgi:hypothetical protein
LADGQRLRQRFLDQQRAAAFEERLGALSCSEVGTATTAASRPLAAKRFGGCEGAKAERRRSFARRGEGSAMPAKSMSLALGQIARVMTADRAVADHADRASFGLHAPAPSARRNERERRARAAPHRDADEPATPGSWPASRSATGKSPAP